MMRARKRVIFAAGIVAAVLLTVVSLRRYQRAGPEKPAPVPVGDYSYTVALAEHRIRQLMSQHHWPSVVVALIDDQDTVWQQAYGLANVEEGLPATTDTVYKVWSVAKVFTAIETMRLAEEGLIDLNAPITDYLPAFSIQSRFADSEPITIRSILSHRSGLPRNECQTVTRAPGDADALRQMVEALRDCHMAFPAGYRFKYSNIGFDLLGHIIEKLRGDGFGHYMEENLLKPIGMESSTFLSAGIPAQADVALGYEYYQGQYYPRQQGDITGLPRGNLYSTIEDLGDFARFVFRGGEAAGKQIINPATLSQMFEAQFSSDRDPQPMGLGWKTARVLGAERMAWHDGGPSEGIGSLVALLPQRKLGVVLLANEVGFEGSVSVPLAIEILALMLETKYGIVPPKEAVPQPVPVDPSVLAEYAGKYVAFGQVMDVLLSGNQLKASIQGLTMDLIPVDQTRFRVSHWLLKLGLDGLLRLPIDLRALEIGFLPNDAGDDVMLINMGDVFYEYCPRYPEPTEIPALWEELTGTYALVERMPAGRVGTRTVGTDEIEIVDGVLRMPGVIGPIYPISEAEIIILSGPFAGETMTYEPGTGRIFHQAYVYRPTDPASP